MISFLGWGFKCVGEKKTWRRAVVCCCDGEVAGLVRIGSTGVGGRSRRSGEEEAGWIGKSMHHTLFAARLLNGGVCVCVVYWS